MTLALCVEMLLSGGLAQDEADARAKLQAVLDSKAAEVFGRMVAAQRGPIDFVERYDSYLPAATLSKPVYAEKPGIISAMDTRALGMAVVSLGGGRRRASDAIDYSVGLTEVARLGDEVDAQQPLAMIHANDEELAAGGRCGAQRNDAERQGAGGDAGGISASLKRDDPRLSSRSVVGCTRAPSLAQVSSWGYIAASYNKIHWV